MSDNGDGRLVVKVGQEVAGYIAEDPDHPGLWVVEDTSSQFMGRVHRQEEAAAFLAAWFIADEQE